MEEFTVRFRVWGLGHIVCPTSVLTWLTFPVSTEQMVLYNSWERKCVVVGGRLGINYLRGLMPRVFSYVSSLTTSMMRSSPMPWCPVGRMTKPIHIRSTNASLVVSVHLDRMQSALFTPYFSELELENFLKYWAAASRKQNKHLSVYYSVIPGSQ